MQKRFNSINGYVMLEAATLHRWSTAGAIYRARGGLGMLDQGLTTVWTYTNAVDRRLHQFS